MIKLNKNGIEYYAFHNFTKENIIHGFPNRKNGYSKEAYSSLNFSYSHCDDEEGVKKNYEKLANAFSIDSYHYGKQTHSKNVTLIDENTTEIFFQDNDGFVSDLDTTLFTYHADCGSVFIYDLKKDCFGMLHSGWRGTSLNITKNALSLMIEKYGSNPEDIIIGIGPSICYDCFEVDLDVAQIFIDKGYIDFVKYKCKTDKYYVDIKNILKAQCLEMGVPLKNIEIASQCTMCDEEEFFSHRRSGINRGTHIGFIKKR